MNPRQILTLSIKKSRVPKHRTVAMFLMAPHKIDLAKPHRMDSVTPPRMAMMPLMTPLKMVTTPALPHLPTPNCRLIAHLYPESSSCHSSNKPLPPDVFGLTMTQMKRVAMPLFFALLPLHQPQALQLPALPLMELLSSLMMSHPSPAKPPSLPPLLSSSPILIQRMNTSYLILNSLMLPLLSLMGLTHLSSSLIQMMNMTSLILSSQMLSLQSSTWSAS